MQNNRFIHDLNTLPTILKMFSCRHPPTFTRAASKTRPGQPARSQAIRARPNSWQATTPPELHLYMRMITKIESGEN